MNSRRQFLIQAPIGLLAVAAGCRLQRESATPQAPAGPRKLALAPTDAPGALWNPMPPGIAAGPSRDRFVRSKSLAVPLPSTDDAIAFAPVTALSRWIEARQLTSVRLTNIYLSRIEQLNPKLNAIITLTKDHALARAARLPTSTQSRRPTDLPLPQA